MSTYEVQQLSLAAPTLTSGTIPPTGIFLQEMNEKEITRTISPVMMPGIELGNIKMKRSDGTWLAFANTGEVMREFANVVTMIPQDGLDGLDAYIPGRIGDTGATGSTGQTGPTGQGVPGIDGVENNYNDEMVRPSISGASELVLTTTGNIDDLDFGNVELIRMNNASLATIRGLRAGYPGQQVTIVSIGAGQVSLAHQNAGSAATYRLINTVTSGITPLAAGKGVATYSYDITTARWRLIRHEQGAWIDIPYAAGNYSQDAGTWTVDSADQLELCYYVQGNIMMFDVSVNATSITPVVTQLRVNLPNGYTTSKRIDTTVYAVNNGGAAEVGTTGLAAGSTFLGFYRPGAAQWTGTNNTQVGYLGAIPIS